MKTCVFGGGPGINIEKAAFIASDCDLVLAADGGADAAVRGGVIPSKVVGDLDSISQETMELLKQHNVPFEVYPCEKDMSDTELCLREVSESDEIILVCSLSGRPDHAVCNMLLALRLHEEGYNITITDGYSDFIPLCGEDMIRIEGIQNPDELYISLIPFTEVSGVSTEGLYYKLNDARVECGTSYTVSNKLEEGSDAFSVSVKSGNMGVLIVPEE